jgi:hypothetical protein
MQKAWVLSQIGDTFPDEVLLPRFSLEVAEAHAAGEHPFVGAMGRLIRTRAAESEFVGSNLMAVWIAQPRHRHVSWEFMPTEPHPASVVSTTETQSFDAVFSPWIIGPNSMSRPSVGTGHFSVRTAGWTIAPVEQVEPKACKRSEAPAGEGRILFALSSQDRVPPPR